MLLPFTDSWSSTSSREGSLPQADPATWVKEELDEASSGSPDAGEDGSRSLMEEPGTFAESERTNSTTTAAPKKQSTTNGNDSKAKVRAAFSESQINFLVQRFSVQRYLTPAEMKNLAEATGLTYKQVWDWFTLVLVHIHSSIECLKVISDQLYFLV